jgi:hypothetical protein
MKTIEYHDSGFYFEYRFDIYNNVVLSYDYNFTQKDKFEICYFDFRNGIKQIRTYLL